MLKIIYKYRFLIFLFFIVLIAIIMLFTVMKNKISNNENTIYDNYTNEYLEDYLNVASQLFNEKSYVEISDKEIISFLIYKLIYEESVDMQKIQQIVKQYFNIDNYNLKAQAFLTTINDEVNITKVDDIYSFIFTNKSSLKNSVTFNSKQITNDYLIVTYNHIKNYNKIGQLQFFMQKVEDNLIIKKIAYNDTTSYDDVTDQYLSEMNDYLSEIINHFFTESIYYFNNDIIREFIVKTYLNYNGKITIEELQDTVYTLFGINNYELELGTFETTMGNTYNISKNNGYYTSSLIEGSSHMYKNEIIKIYKKDKLMVVEVKCQKPNSLEDNTYKTIGTSNIYISINNDNYIINKIVYNKST
ncbi:MAG: hypothetical protein PHE54_00875 [Bacilli bacterium]|nr:hypothetical protein [Bacilli bacterium]